MQVCYEYTNETLYGAYGQDVLITFLSETHKEFYSLFPAQ